MILRDSETRRGAVKGRTHADEEFLAFVASKPLAWTLPFFIITIVLDLDLVAHSRLFKYDATF